MYVLVWIDSDGVANAGLISTETERLEQKIYEEWARDCAQDWPDEKMENALTRSVDSGSGSIVFSFVDPVTGASENYAFIDKAEVI